MQATAVQSNTTVGDKWDFGVQMPEASEKELRSFRLNQFNEKFSDLIERRKKADGYYFNYVKEDVMQDPTYLAPHLKVGPGVVRNIVLAVGDPFRCEVLAKLCDKFEEIAWNREYRMYNIEYDGALLTIVSHGIGGPGAAICFEELVKCGATTIIRLGTCGAMQSHIKTGDLIVATAACREDGYSNLIAPSGFPAVADQQVTISLFNQARSMKCNVHQGVALTSGLFYDGKAIPSSMKVNADCGAVMVEMEIAALFTLGTMRGIRCAAIATADGNVFETGNYDPHGTIVAEGKINMMKAGLRVAASLSKEMAQEEDPSIFEKNLQDKYLDTFNTKNLCDYFKEISELNADQKKALCQMTSKGSLTNFLFYLDNATKLSEEEIQQCIILFHKVQKKCDDDFNGKSQSLMNDK